MPKPRSPRPANRPSRRHEILEAAVDLLAVQPPDEIAVSDIAAHCGMTPAAFYYHFASKDEILDEIVAEFAARWSETRRRRRWPRSRRRRTSPRASTRCSPGSRSTSARRGSTS